MAAFNHGCPGMVVMTKPRLGMAKARRLATPPKVAAADYQSPEHKAWREAVIARAGRRCEAVIDGKRCWKAEPRHRMFADHIVEIKDGGARLDPDNGQCLCGAHHTAKTAATRAARRFT